MKTFLKTNFPFFIPYIIFIVLGAVLIVVNNKSDTHLEFNGFHNSFFDTIFYFITYLGDGITATLIVLLLLAYKFRSALIVGVSNIIASLITQLLKHTVFADVVRPKKFFEGVHDLYFVPGVQNYLYNSFPSGHSTCAFSLYFALALLTENKLWKFVLCITALMVAYSRIYLSQHFFEDVYAGSLIGVITTGVVYYFIQKSNKNWLERSISTVFK